MASVGRIEFQENGTGELKHLLSERAIGYENRFVGIER
jgi:hypothetical protein